MSSDADQAAFFGIPLVVDDRIPPGYVMIDNLRTGQIEAVRVHSDSADQVRFMLRMGAETARWFTSERTSE